MSGLRPLVIYGSSGFGREAAQVVDDINDVKPTWDLLGYLDDRPEWQGKTSGGRPILGTAEWLKSHPGTPVFVGIGSSAGRRKAVLKAKSFGATEFPTLVSPRAWIGRRVTLGQGTIVCAMVAITNDITIGDFTLLNLSCTVGHDAVLGEFTTLSPSTNISGNVTLGAGCDFGTNASVVPKATVGEWTIVGAGAVVNADIPANVTAVGVPAKPIKTRAAGWHES